MFQSWTGASINAVDFKVATLANFMGTCELCLQEERAPYSRIHGALSRNFSNQVNLKNEKSLVSRDYCRFNSVVLL